MEVGWGEEVKVSSDKSLQAQQSSCLFDFNPMGYRFLRQGCWLTPKCSLVTGGGRQGPFLSIPVTLKAVLISFQIALVVSVL